MGVAPADEGGTARTGAAGAATTGAAFLVLALRLYRTRDDKAMRKAGRALFAYSLSYLFVIFCALLADRAVGVMGWL